MRYLSKAILVGGALLSSAAVANAQNFSGSGCGGDGFLLCASWSGVISGSTLTLTVNNTSDQAPANNPNSMFTLIGLGGVSTTLGNPTSLTTTGTGVWHLVTGTQEGLNGLHLVSDSTQFGAHDNTPVAQEGLSAGNTTTFTFTWASAIDATAFAGVQIGIHDQAGPGGTCAGSSKALFNGTTGENLGEYNDCNPGTVPEPPSVALIGTALVGLVGTGVGRRIRSLRRSTKTQV